MALNIKIRESVMSPKAAIKNLEPTDAGAIYRILKSYNPETATDYLDGLEILRDNAVSIISESLDEMARPIGTTFNDTDELYIHPIGTTVYVKAFYARNIKGLDYFVCEHYDSSLSYDASKKVQLEICDNTYTPQPDYRYELVDSDLRPKFFDITAKQLDALENVAAQFISTRPYYIVCKAYKNSTPRNDTVELNGRVYQTRVLGGIQWFAEPIQDYFKHGNGTYQYSRPDIKKYIEPSLKGIGYRLPTKTDLFKLCKDPRVAKFFKAVIPAESTPFQYITSSEPDGTVLYIGGSSRVPSHVSTMGQGWDPQEIFIAIPCKDVD